MVFYRIFAKNVGNCWPTILPTEMCFNEVIGKLERHFIYLRSRSVYMLLAFSLHKCCFLLKTRLHIIMKTVQGGLTIASLGHNNHCKIDYKPLWTFQNSDNQRTTNYKYMWGVFYSIILIKDSHTTKTVTHVKIKPDLCDKMTCSHREWEESLYNCFPYTWSVQLFTL